MNIEDFEAMLNLEAPQVKQMNIQEFEAIVKQTLGLEGIAEEKSENTARFEIFQEEENVTIGVTYCLGDKRKWGVEIKRKFEKGDDLIQVVKDGRWAFSPDLEEGEYLLFHCYGEGETLTEALNDVLF